MTLTDELKILDDKIKANQVQYDLDREAVKISALSSKELDKYEYLAGEDLAYKPGVVEQVKFEYSPLGKVFNKGLEKEDKLLTRLKHIEDTTKDQSKSQLKPIENDVKSTKKNAFKTLKLISELSLEAKERFDEIKWLDRKIDYIKLVCVHTNGKMFDFNIFTRLRDFFRSIYFDDISLEQAMDKHDEIEYLLRNLEAYNPRNSDKIKSKEEVLKNAGTFIQGRKLVVISFKNDIFPLSKVSQR